MAQAEDDLEALGKILNTLQSLPFERRRRIVKTLMSLLDIAPDEQISTPSGFDDPTAQSPLHPRGHSRVPFSQERSITPKDFLLQKQPRTDVERIACIAYYLTHY